MWCFPHYLSSNSAGTPARELYATLTCCSGNHFSFYGSILFLAESIFTEKAAGAHSRFFFSRQNCPMLTAHGERRPTGRTESAGAARGCCSVRAEATRSTAVFGHRPGECPGLGCCLIVVCVITGAGTKNGQSVSLWEQSPGFRRVP